MTSPSPRLRALLLAQDCNPEWPSLPVVGYKYARALAAACDVVLVTHVRNRPAIEAAADPGLTVDYVDTEYLAAPLYRLAKLIRGGDQVNWSANMMLAYPAYLEFERRVWGRYARALRAGAFDVVHRLTPMSPTLPSYMAGKGGVPFVQGPLNGALDWPEAYRAEMVRERETLRRFRGLHRRLPFSRRGFARSAAILAAFDHTAADLPEAVRDRVISFPEIGFDETLFHPPARPRDADGEPARLRFLFAGRLVPYKLPEAAVRAFLGDGPLADHELRLVGDGPEAPRLRALVEAAGAQDRVLFLGRRSQAEVAEEMRAADVFVFPSIRELGAGVVIEAMACEMACVVADYGAPGALAADGRGHLAPMAPLEGMVATLRGLMERCVADRADMRARARAGRAYAFDGFTWAEKAQRTLPVYEWVLGRRAAPPPGYA